MKFTDRAIITMNRPGHQNSQGRVEKADWYSEIIVPRDTSGDLIPKPEVAQRRLEQHRLARPAAWC